MARGPRSSWLRSDCATFIHPSIPHAFFFIFLESLRIGVVVGRLCDDDLPGLGLHRVSRGTHHGSCCARLLHEAINCPSSAWRTSLAGGRVGEDYAPRATYSASVLSDRDTLWPVVVVLIVVVGVGGLGFARVLSNRGLTARAE